jgi:hypothetical protein
MTTFQPGLSDYSLFLQTEIDNAIATNQAVLDWRGRGLMPCKTPLIVANYQPNQNAYWPFTLRIIGNKSYTGADGTGDILDCSSFTDGFGINFQGGKGCSIYGLEIKGAFINPTTNAKEFYSSRLDNYSVGKCSEAKYHPYFAVAQDYFGPSVPSDGGLTGNDAYGKPWLTYYHGSTNGSTGLYMDNLFLRDFVGGFISSCNGLTNNGDMTIGECIHFENMKYNVCGCQPQEKMNRFSNCISWGATHTIFATGIFGASTPGNYYFDHWNIAGLTNQLMYVNESQYFQSQWDCMTVESIGRIGTIYSVNGTKVSNSKIDFAGYVEAGFYITDHFNGYGVTFDGCQLRTYGQPTPLVVATGPYANNFHFRDCSFDFIPIYPQTYPYGFTDFQNCIIGGQSSANILNPMGPSKPSIYKYGQGSDVAGNIVYFDQSRHDITQPIITKGIVTVGEAIVGTSNFIDFKVLGVVQLVEPNGFTLGYTDPSIDLTKQYYLGQWQTIMK